MMSNSLLASSAGAASPPAGAAIATAGAAALTPQYSSRNLTNLLISSALILSSSPTSFSNSLGVETLSFFDCLASLASAGASATAVLLSSSAIKLSPLINLIARCERLIRLAHHEPRHQKLDASQSDYR